MGSKLEYVIHLILLFGFIKLSFSKKRKYQKEPHCNMPLNVPDCSHRI